MDKNYHCWHEFKADNHGIQMMQQKSGKIHKESNEKIRKTWLMIAWMFVHVQIILALSLHEVVLINVVRCFLCVISNKQNISKPWCTKTKRTNNRTISNTHKQLNIKQQSTVISFLCTLYLLPLFCSIKHTYNSYSIFNNENSVFCIVSLFSPAFSSCFELSCRSFMSSSLLLLSLTLYLLEWIVSVNIFDDKI